MSGVIDWSARHTRLRYQSVLSALAFISVSTLGVGKIELIGFFEFIETPNQSLMRAGCLAFAVFSLLSFAAQDSLENSLGSNDIYTAKDKLDAFSKPFRSGNPLSIMSKEIDDIADWWRDKEEWEEGSEKRNAIKSIRSSLGNLTMLQHILEIRVSEVSKVMGEVKVQFPRKLEKFDGIIAILDAFNSKLRKAKFRSDINIPSDEHIFFSDEEIGDIIEFGGVLEIFEGLYDLNVKTLHRTIAKRAFLLKLQSRLLPFWTPACVALTLILFGIWFWLQ